MTEAATSDRIDIRELVIEQKPKPEENVFLSEADLEKVYEAADHIQADQVALFGESAFRLFTLAPEFLDRYKDGDNILFFKTLSSGSLAALSVLRLISPVDYEITAKQIKTADFVKVSNQLAKEGQSTFIAQYVIAFPGELGNFKLSDHQEFIPDHIQDFSLAHKADVATDIRIIFPEFERNQLVSDHEIENLKNLLDGAKLGNQWTTALEYAFQLHILTADEVRVADSGLHIVHKQKTDFAENSADLPVTRSF